MLRQRLFTTADALAVRRLSRKESRLGQRVRSALAVIDEAIERYGDALSLSFNGGKDCTVLVHLYAAASACPQSTLSSSSSTSSPGRTSRSPTRNSPPKAATNGASSLSDTVEAHSPLPCIYVQCQSPFPQVENFVDECRQRYRLDLRRISAPMKEALALYKQERESQDAQPVEAVLVGTRLGDPFAETLQTFAPTDADWPALMRVHPILDWTYADIWEFLRCPDLGDGGVGWCVLYDYGYTSLGSTFNTIPNPELRDATRESGWRPAWELEDASAERAGRPAGPIPKAVSSPLKAGKV